MKTKLTTLCCLLTSICVSVFAQGTAFTYQGRLNDGANPANGSYDLQFTLFTTNQFGFPAGPILTNAGVIVNNGLFATTLDFGDGIFTGTNFWLDVSVRTNGGGAFTPLAPRQPITPVPYAITAETVNSFPGLTVQQNADGAPNMIGGSPVNFVSAGFVGATIAGGGVINFEGESYTNSVTSDFGTVSGGNANTAAYYGTVGGGGGNTSRGLEFATVGGGEENTSGGSWATVPGGKYNLASGDYSFAAGQQAQALHQGAFVWSDSQAGAYSSDRNNQFKIRAGGGIQMDVSGSSGLNPAAVAISSTSGNGIGLLVNESSTDTSALFANNGTGDIIKGFSGGGNTVFEVLNDGTIISKGVVLTSDRNAKENFAALDAQTILTKVISLPITEWNYKTDPAGTKHLGPMAQDFHAAFALNGADDKHISVIDEGGVALAAIQGLNQKLEETRKENAELKQQLSELKVLVRQLAQAQK